MEENACVETVENCFSLRSFISNKTLMVIVSNLGNEAKLAKVNQRGHQEGHKR